jgi:hypothetical protein
MAQLYCSVAAIPHSAHPVGSVRSSVCVGMKSGTTASKLPNAVDTRYCFDHLVELGIGTTQQDVA